MMNCIELLVSFGIVIMTCFLSQIIRSQLKQIWGGRNEEVKRLFVEEFVAMFEMCATCYEIGVGEFIYN